MKIPSSSSIIFATLAISSSSSSLAAPTGDASHSEGAMASSGSNQLVARHDPTSTTPFGRSDQPDDGDDKQPELSARHPDSELEGRGPVGPLCTVLGLVPANLVPASLLPALDAVEGLFECSTSTAASAESVDDDPVTVEQIQSALASASSSLVSQASNLPVSPPISRPDPPVPVSAVLGAAPVPTAVQSVLARDVAPGEPPAAPTPPTAPSAPGTPSPSAPPNTPKPPTPSAPGPPTPLAPGVVTGAAGMAADRVPVSPPVGDSRPA